MNLVSKTTIPNPDWTWASDDLEFQAKAAVVRQAAEALLVEMFGERCPEYIADCECCRRWRLLDELLENPFAEGEDTGANS